MKKKWPLFVILPLICAALGAAIVYAITYHQVPFDMIIKPTVGEAHFEMFNDQETTSKLVAIHFGEVQYNKQLVFDFWVKNTGNAAGTPTIYIMEDTSSWLINNQYTGMTSVAPGQVIKVTWEGKVVLNPASDTIMAGTFQVVP